MAMTKKAENEDLILADLDQLINECDDLITGRLQPAKNAPLVQSNTLLESNDPLDLFDLDNILDGLSNPPIKPIQPVESSCRKPINLDEYRCSYEHTGVWMEFFLQKKFCDHLKAEIQQMYSVKTTITKSHDKTPLKNPIYVVEFEGNDKEKVDEAKDSSQKLFQCVEIKLIDDQFGFWVRFPDCLRIVQAYSDQNEHLHLLYEHNTALGLMITYFNKDKSPVLINLCTNNATLIRILKEKFLSVDIVLPSTSDLTKENKSYLAQDILKLQSEIVSQPILMVLEQRRIRLFGFVDLVKDIEKKLEDSKGKHVSNTAKLNLEPAQIEYLLDVYNDELKALEKNYPSTTILDSLQRGEFTAPSYLHDTIEKEIQVMAVLAPAMSFTVDHQAFSMAAHDQCSNLIKIGRQKKCQITIEEIVSDQIVPTPTATAQDHISNKLTAAAIEIRQGDLADQKVDLVVVCSKSFYLCKRIVENAGASVVSECVAAIKTATSEPVQTNSGNLKCRKLLFLPLKMNQTNSDAFYQSIREFVARAVEYGIKAHHTSIAFPAIGCGKLNFDKNIIANEMLVEAQKQLLTANVLLQIIFVILPTKCDVFQAFQSKLDNLQKGNIERKENQFSYKLTTLKIKVKSSTVERQEQCQKEIHDYVQTSVLEKEHLQQDVLKKWTQPVINELYRFSFNRKVLIDMQIQIGYMKLSGLKESVNEVENEYYRTQVKQSEQARLAAIARNIIWAYQIDPNTSEKYPPELNERIEDAYSSKNHSFNYTNDQGDQYQIDFQTMMESCATKQIQHRVIRDADFHPPEYWEVQLDNVKRFPVQVDSKEYNEICILFDKTMTGQYMAIIRIERIQNKPWYMQYNSYRSFSPKKNTERRLFHGCPQQSAELIIHSFFNRSFAGINGIVYGQGAYFSANAKYSHGYAQASTMTGERHMFVANVLVGDTILGNRSMKTPPTGYDSTTDGDHIFVTYRDDQAYASYLIVYK